MAWISSGRRPSPSPTAHFCRPRFATTTTRGSHFRFCNIRYLGSSLVPSCRVSSIPVFPSARHGSLVWVRPGTRCLYNWAPYLMQCRHEYWDRLNKMVIKIYSIYHHIFRIHLNFYYSSCTPLHAMQKSQSNIQLVRRTYLLLKFKNRLCFFFKKVSTRDSTRSRMHRIYVPR